LPLRYILYFLPVLTIIQLPVIIRTAKTRKQKIFPAILIMIVLLNQWFRIVRPIVRIFFTVHMANIIVAMMATVKGVMLMSHGEIMIM